jgi:glutaminase
MELVGALSFVNTDYVTRRLAERARPALFIIDLRRVPAVTEGAAHLIADVVRDLGTMNVTVIFSGTEQSSPVWDVIGAATKSVTDVRRFDLLDEAIEWAEDQVIYRYGGFSDNRDSSLLDSQALLAGLTAAELAELSALATSRTFHTGERIIAAGEPAASIFFLLSGMVSVKLHSGVRLASLSHGMVFGEMALIEKMRSADVWGDTPVTCLELTIEQFETYCDRHRPLGRRILRNLATLIANRLIQANAKVDLLSAY